MTATDENINEMDFITFRDLVQELTGSSFDEIYKKFLEREAENGQKSDME